MAEPIYYIEFLKHLDDPLLLYFKNLSEADWEELFDDLYKEDFRYLLRILITPRDETLQSYALVLLKDVDSHTHHLITQANNKLISKYINGKELFSLNELLDAVGYLKLPIDLNILSDLIKNESFDSEIREAAASTLIDVHENLLTNFWDEIDYSQNKFLIPAYLTFYINKNPIKGINKLLTIDEEPADLALFETPIVYSLYQISTSPFFIEEYLRIEKAFPEWLKQNIKRLFNYYPELEGFRLKIQHPYEPILTKIGLTSDIFNDEYLTDEMKAALETLLEKLKKKPRLLKNTIQKNYSMIQPSYIGKMGDVIDELSALVYSLDIGKIQFTSTEPVFDIPENSIYYDNPTVFLYPYFLDIDRIEKAGVIPYATQISIAIIIHKDNSHFRQWEKLRERIDSRVRIENNSDQKSDLHIPVTESRRWLIELIKSIYENKGEVHSVRGYVFHSIIKQFVIDNMEDDDILGQIIKAPTDLTYLTKKLEFFKDPAPGDADKLNKNSVLLLDPADAFQETENGQSFMVSLHPSFRVIHIRHGMKIPVGIGFSLYALPRLLQNGNWKVLQKFMIENIANLHGSLYNVGISLLSETSSKESMKLI